MAVNMLRQMTLGVATVLSLAIAPGTPTLAQATKTTVTNLSENQGYIRGCRQLNQRAEVFDNTSLGPVANRLGTLQAGTRVRLTGVLAPGRAQIFLDSSTLSSIQPVGWINAGALTPCGSTPPPPANRACYRANFDLNVRSGPSSTTSLVANYNAGDVIRATTNPPTQQTSPNSAPDFGRVWMQVSIFNNNTGWIARTGPNGQGSNVTSIPCP